MPKFKILTGQIRADDGSLKGAGDEIDIADDQVERFPGQLEPVAAEAASVSAPAPAPAPDVDVHDDTQH